MEGWLEKAPAGIGRTQRRYFVATRERGVAHVIYFVDERCQTQVGYFDVSPAAGHTAAALQGTSFSVESSKRKFVLRAASAAERDGWLAYFQGRDGAGSSAAGGGASQQSAARGHGAATSSDKAPHAKAPASAGPALLAKLKDVQLADRKEQRQKSGIADKDSGFDGLGVSATFLRHFMAQHKLDGLTTTEVCQQIVMPQTKDAQCSFLQLLQRQPPQQQQQQQQQPFVGPARVFVSHAWKYQFSEVMAVLLDYADRTRASQARARKEGAAAAADGKKGKDQQDGEDDDDDDDEEVYFWFDLFTNNQHAATSYPFEWWCNTFQKNIEYIGEVLLVMIPWSDPIPLTRAWCLWEIYCSLKGSVPLSVGLPPSERRAFLEGLSESIEAITNALVRIDAERSEAFKKEDQDNIHRAVRESPLGFEGLNREVKSHLRDWYLGTALEVAEEFALQVAASSAQQQAPSQAGAPPPKPKRASSMGILPRLSDDGSEGGGGNSSSSRSNSNSGGDSADTADATTLTLMNLATSLAQYGLNDESLRFFGISLTRLRATVGEQHPTTGTVYTNLGLTYQSMGDMDAALEALEQAARIYEAIFGQQHPRTAKAYNNLAIAYRDMGQLDKALSLNEETLQIRLATIGEAHEETAGTYNNIGELLTSMGDLPQALAMTQKAIQIYEALPGVGRQHPSTGRALSNAAGALFYMDRPAEARPLFERSLQICLATVGENHPETAGSYANLANCLDTLGMAEQSVEMTERALQIYLATVGEMHSDTGSTYTNLGSAYCGLGRHADASAALDNALRIQQAVHGQRHPHTAGVHVNIGVNLLAMGRRIEGKATLRRALDMLLATVGPDHHMTEACQQALASAD